MKIVLTPDWFLGKDVLIDIFSFIVLLAFFIICARSYKAGKKKSSLYLGAGFLMIALAQLSSILTKTLLYYDMSFTQHIGQAIITYHVLKSVDIVYYAGFFMHRLLTLAGLFVICKLPAKRLFSTDLLLASYFILISALVSTNMYYIFHLTVLALAMLIIWNYMKIYEKNRNPNTKTLIVGFGIFAFSHLIYSFSKLEEAYVAANMIELASFLVFLSVIIKILRPSGRKTDKEA